MEPMDCTERRQQTTNLRHVKPQKSEDNCIAAEPEVSFADLFLILWKFRRWHQFSCIVIFIYVWPHCSMFINQVQYLRYLLQFINQRMHI